MKRALWLRAVAIAIVAGSACAAAACADASAEVAANGDGGTGNDDAAPNGGDAAGAGDGSKDGGALGDARADDAIAADGGTCDLAAPANCGACGNDCSKGLCKQGICTLVDSNALGGLYAPEGIAIAGTTAYVTVAGQPIEVGRCPTNGCIGGLTPIVAFDGGTSHEPMAIVVDQAASTVFWTSYENATATGGVYKTPTSGGAATQLNAGHSTSFADSVARIGSAVVWSSDDSPGGILQCPTSGCGSTGPGLVGGVNAYGKGVIAGANDSVIFAANGEIRWCATLACVNGAKSIATSQGLGVGAMALAGDGDTLYWAASYPSNAIMFRSISAATGAPQQLVATSQAPSAMLIVGDTLYWTITGTDPNPHPPTFPLTNTSDGAVRKCKLPGCSPVLDIAVNAAAPGALATDGAAIFWVETGVAGNLAGRGAIKKAPL